MVAEQDSVKPLCYDCSICLVFGSYIMQASFTMLKLFPKLSKHSDVGSCQDTA